MTNSQRIWGLHNDVLGQELLDGGFISIGWPAVGDLRQIGNDQLKMREAVARVFPAAKPGAIPVWAGMLRRFAFEAQVGDVVIFPSKHDRSLNFGRITGSYEYDSSRSLQPHLRRVQWLKTGVARSLFSQSALYEVGSALTMFAVRNYAEEFLAFLGAEDDESFVRSHLQLQEKQTEEEAQEAVSEMPNADRIDQHTRDFVANMLLTELSHEEFEHFTADLLRCMGYQARVTQYAVDGGIDVVAHKDLLGVEPPIIKVQCKHTSATQGGPVVQQLLGTLDRDEAGLFFTLGSYSADALKIERQKQNIRLFSGADITDLVLRYYEQLPSKWRSKFPLRSVLAVDEN
ncbi:restriction endonuclease [Boudabousia marimammalium]|uniref:Restriction endonuclease n=1 Tax=Boudabousia marimammalium TaxID=156892 RepID=A0A1Q5PSD3_9ACTO|nr:restriction endonuclease [Boudabousia marimammalium]OKL50419.1 restriction endonuclease [Boudabousia marimammalium]